MVTVPASAGMDAETFRKHLELRHLPFGDFANMTRLVPSAIEPNRSILETYHRYLHERFDYPHEHVE
jgi:hypothetical protein